MGNAGTRLGADEASHASIAKQVQNFRRWGLGGLMDACLNQIMAPAPVYRLLWK